MTLRNLSLNLEVGQTILVGKNDVPATITKIESFLNGLLDEVSVIEALSEENTLIDVRTAKEYEKGSIPDAFNYPLFDNLERAEIGIIYKNIGKNAAVEKGLEFFEPRIQQFLSSLTDLKSKRLVVFCARGGMRSASVVRLLQYQGFQAAQLQGGYKSYRSYVLKQLSKPAPPLIVIHGRTGVGKTLLLKKLPDHLDLEEFAGHRSSLFGAINKMPQTQKNFEALLANKILELNPHGVFLSNGPGDPAATGKYAINIIQTLIKKDIPIFGICLGHQLLALALKAKTKKMKLGHRGANHPVKNLINSKVEITSQNHGFEVIKDSLPKNVEMTHKSLFDNSVEGIKLKNKPVFSVQYHPESNPGPQDSHYLFNQFINEVKKNAKKKRY